MSQWTHVNAIFRLDSFGRISDKKIIEVFGKQVDYDKMYSVEYDENYDVKDKAQYLPMGSEGTLKMSIWHNPDNHCLASTTVSVFGDLRDYSDYNEIKDWFNKCCNSFLIRQAICQVEVERCETKVFMYENEN